MSRFLISFLVVLATSLAYAATNLPPATSILLDDNKAFELTAGLAQYENPPRFAGKFTCVGSGVVGMLVNRWATEFAGLYPDVEMDAHGGGSESGFSGLLEGTVDMVPLSHSIPAEDLARFKTKFGYPPADIVVAQDAAGVYVNKNNPAAGLTLAQLEAIYSRESKRGGERPEFWSDVGVTGALAEERISRYSLSAVHGSYMYFQELILEGGEYRFDVSFERVPSSLVQAVGADNAGIGLASIMFATARTRFVPVQGAHGRYLLPTYENTVSGEYPLTRPMRIIFNRKPDGTMNPVAREFLRFAVSRRGQRIISLAGSYPLTVQQQQEALKTIGDAERK